MKKEILYQEIARTIACQIKKGVWKAGCIFRSIPVHIPVAYKA